MPAAGGFVSGLVANRVPRQKRALLADENVVAYLGSMEVAKSDIADEAASNEPDDFS